MSKFIYITEDQEMFWTEDGPTEHDKAAIKVGILTVIRTT